MAARQQRVLGKRNRSEGNCKESGTSTDALITTSQLQQLGVHQVMDAARYSSWKKLLLLHSAMLREVVS